MYQPTIGLEIHIELKTRTKMFCSCLNNPDEKKPNLNICPICMGHPGTLPVINEEAVTKVIKTGLAFNSEIPNHSKFDRKNYFYPDLPKGYQISQYDKPLCVGGYLEIPTDQGSLKRIRITRVHLEEDTGSLAHPEGENYSLVNFNRAGIPLMELVTEPDIASAYEAKKFAEDLHLIMHYLDVSDADMEKGQMRVEVNISLSEKKGELGTKAEIKNLNSFRSVERAIDYEIKRQKEILESGGKILQETRGWDDVKGITVSQREKEEAHDYRYLPEPDLPGLRFSKEFIGKIKSEIPELPVARKNRLMQEYALTDKE
ncbi:MAG: Asp-tRNA(Asn)/Glu-tRNA(Gln) amidotransferase subunit GatB, partial [bacterium]|nr:Asp-tRNA(Asn)/Glu-tRNA(Gln) amidotransferase subunit GatB [bacterium]